MDRYALADTYTEVKTRAAAPAAAALDRLMQAVGAHESGLVAQGVLAELPAARFEVDVVNRISDRYQRGAVGGTVARYEGLLLGAGTKIVLTNPGADPARRKGSSPKSPAGRRAPLRYCGPRQSSCRRHPTLPPR